jgi:O-antigen/teichoic acid export membrane protein
VLLSFALPSLLSGLIVLPIAWLANTILVRSPNGMAEMGMFNAANQWRNLIIWIPAAIGEVALPILSNLLSAGDRARFNRALMLNVAMNLLVSLAVALPLALGSYWIMSLYGSAFSHRWFALVMICGTAVLQATISVIGQVIASASRMWWGFFLNLLWSIEFIVLTVYLVRFGANGLAGAYFLAYVLHLFQVAAYTIWVLRHDPRLTQTNTLASDAASLAGVTDSAEPIRMGD